MRSANDRKPFVVEHIGNPSYLLNYPKYFGFAPPHDSDCNKTHDRGKSPPSSLDLILSAVLADPWSHALDAVLRTSLPSTPRHCRQQNKVQSYSVEMREPDRFRANRRRQCF